jgi:chitinase
MFGVGKLRIWGSIDLDIEGGGTTGYVAFVNKIRSLASGASKK